MCGIVGIYHFNHGASVDEHELEKMLEVIRYRGPDDQAIYAKDSIGFAYSRLATIDLELGKQPYMSDDGKTIAVCNGEIFNYKTLRAQLISKGYHFKTNSDVEVIIPLYLEYGADFLNRLNGQFAIAIYDETKQQLMLARDQFGICPLYYTVLGGSIFFASEIKALLAHPMIPKAVNLIGLDQVLTFPGVISPTTLFKDIFSLKAGSYLKAAKQSDIKIQQYWDFNFPKAAELTDNSSESFYLEEFNEIFTQAVSLRLQADVPIGVYLSGGLDSSLVLAKMRELLGNHSEIISLSADFDSKFESERQYQIEASSFFNTQHHSCMVNTDQIAQRLSSIVYHAESPLKETFNTATLALSELANQNQMKVMLAGQGADELFAGYVGYLFDLIRNSTQDSGSADEVTLRKQLWGDETFTYEKQYGEFELVKQQLYSQQVNSFLNHNSGVNEKIIDKEVIAGCSTLARRSYIDLKLRLADHLLSDHGDRMALANSVEVRYPFLDINVINFAMRLPDELKISDGRRKYFLKKYAEHYLPMSIVNREKQGFSAPGSPVLLQGNYDFINDMLSYERIKSQGYFNADTVEKLRKQYSAPGYRIKVPFESDLLMTVLTFNIFIDLFNLS